MRTIASPGVEITEIDRSLRPVLPTGTNVVVPGFSQKGPSDELVKVTSLSEFEQIYGLPRTPAERYFYHSVKPILQQSPANLFTYRLPYGQDGGEGFSNNYSVLAYPAVPLSIKQSLEDIIVSNITLTLNLNLNSLTVNALSGVQFSFQGSTGEVLTVGFGIDGQPHGRNSGIGTDANTLLVNVNTSALSSNTDILNQFESTFLNNSLSSKIDTVNFFVDQTSNSVTFNLSGNGVPLTYRPTQKQSLLPGLDDEGDVLTLTQVSSASPVNSNFGQKLTTYGNQTEDVVYVLGRPTYFQLSEDQYKDIVQKRTFTWKNDVTNNSIIDSIDELGNAAMLVLNSGQTTIDQKFQGYYVGLIDNTNNNPATDFDGLRKVSTITKEEVSESVYTTVPRTRLDFALSGLSDATGFVPDEIDSGDGSISETMENFTEYNLGTTEYDDTVSLGLFRLRQSPFSPDTIKLVQTLEESYVGSFDYHREIASQNGGVPIPFNINVYEGQSPNIHVMVNEYISRENGETWLDNNGIPSNKVRLTSQKTDSTSEATSFVRSISASFGIVDTDPQANDKVITLGDRLASITSDIGKADELFPLGVYSNTNTKTKLLGSIPRKVSRMLDKVENVDIFNIDITCDAGLSTIHSVQNEIGLDAQYYDDSVDVPAIEGMETSNVFDIDQAAKNFRSNWNTIFQQFTIFAEKRRKDHLFIADLPRHIFVKGLNTRVLDDDRNNFSLNVAKPIEAITSIANTSYATTYAQWAKVYDSVLDRQVWVPFSGFAAAAMANNDANAQPWFAPSGFTRGVVAGVNDLAIYPKQKQRDSLYRLSVNPVAFFPGEGYVIYGQKTLLKRPSAFDRINVRRLFLYLEKATRNTVKYFVFEPNTLLTRTRVLNVLRPIFNLVKNTEGVYDHLLVADERNNTPTVIDNNELVVDIYLKPVRAAEFILVNFHATRTNTDFNELVG